MLLRFSPLPPMEPLVAILQAVVILLRAPTALSGQCTCSWSCDAVFEWAAVIGKLNQVIPTSRCAMVAILVFGSPC